MEMRGWARQARHGMSLQCEAWNGRQGMAGQCGAGRGNAGDANYDGERPVAARKDGRHLNNEERHERKDKK